MKFAVLGAARLWRAGEKAICHRGSFFAVSLVIFILHVGVLARFDLLPQAPSASAEALVVQGEKAEAVAARIPAMPEGPTRVVIKRLGVDEAVENPVSSTIEVLDAALLEGAVRHPASARLGEAGNVVIFGHSSALPVVHNQAFKAFDGIGTLVEGDEILVYSSTQIYIYRVRLVEHKSAESGAIPLTVRGKVLTLATCDSFGKKSDRFVVTAEFVESHALPK
jgi:LPXTG-site transpeptidase (sortase) family protein